MQAAPNPNAARLFYNWAMGRECQQLNVDAAGLRSAHALVRERPGRKSLDQIKLMREDPVAVEAQSDAIKARYSALFGVSGAAPTGVAARRLRAFLPTLERAVASAAGRGRRRPGFATPPGKTPLRTSPRRA
jgi:hypothetical protein